MKIEKENNMTFSSTKSQKILSARLFNLHFEKIKTINYPLCISKEIQQFHILEKS